eukprot:c38438_g1_i1 orf=3-158(-)
MIQRGKLHLLNGGSILINHQRSDDNSLLPIHFCTHFTTHTHMCVIHTHAHTH